MEMLTDNLTTLLSSLNNTKDIFILSVVFMLIDVGTGYLKAFKNHNINSSVSRDGYIKKVGWFVALILGMVVQQFVHTKAVLLGSALMCIGTEGISIYENLGALGVNLPFSKYFEKIIELQNGTTETKTETKVETTTEDTKESGEYEDI